MNVKGIRMDCFKSLQLSFKSFKTERDKFLLKNSKSISHQVLIKSVVLSMQEVQCNSWVTPQKRNAIMYKMVEWKWMEVHLTLRYMISWQRSAWISIACISNQTVLKIVFKYSPLIFHTVEVLYRVCHRIHIIPPKSCTFCEVSFYKLEVKLSAYEI